VSCKEKAADAAAKPAGTPDSSGGSTLALPVVGQEVRKGDLILSVVTTGQIRSEAVSVLKSETQGTITEVLVRPGDRVKEGQALVQVDPRPLDMAVREAVTNAVLHGNKLDEAKVVDLKLSNSPEAFEIIVHDQGRGFDPREIPDPTKEENLLKTSGRGIFFMRNFMDTVDWSADPKGGTTVRMMKKL